jgi:hypothetical protein
VSDERDQQDAPSDALFCEHCGASLECCEGCEREACDAATCYRCLIAGLGESLVGVHQHGG